MKVLWFTTSPSNAAAEFGYSHQGCGWISALETIIVGSGEHELGICFIYEGHEYKKIIKDKVVYYGIPSKKRNGLERILNRQLFKIEDEFESPIYDEVIKEFQPDLIHVFGTENGYGKILQNKFEKVIFHLQGLAAPYYEVYFPPNVSKWQALRKDSLNNIIRGLTFFHGYHIFSKRVQREINIVKTWKYFSGRTDFDRNYVQLLHSTATYFHCEELLRPEFFKTEWRSPGLPAAKARIVIGTTVNPNIYKGLDVIYRALALLDDYDIEWNIFGVAESNNFNRVIKKTLAAEIRIPSVRFHGSVNADTLVTQLKKCHFFIHPSYIDNSPNSVCEAMLLGMPVLASSVGGIKTLINNGENGYLFNPHDKYDLAGLIVHLIHNYNKATDAGKNARATAVKRHDSDTIIADINKMYYDVKNEII
ncbi:glycosyltransferase family 4 protein [Ferruginibacter paludis]|uniref:glycosyltransferase family 4 protein n=1 Tax=Ferruginibacter paludis TaxID=1310417 RepID=UPI0025B402D0|nr:glycosyltransferase family 4 protein [Ferruginibacter paludis]MDN3655838.1 glycosyltransferase family 4 protein [Ferruginibacter paludis]